MTAASLLFVAGAAAALLLLALLLGTYIEPKLGFWPARASSLQSYLFWILFRAANASTLALAALAWQPWDAYPTLRIAGLAVATLSFSAYAFSCLQLGHRNLYCGRAGLITRGLYRWSRNPQYATAVAGYLGLAVASQSIYALTLAALLSGSYYLMAVVEEPWLAATYHDAYERYRRRVARFYSFGRLRSLARLPAIAALKRRMTQSLERALH